MIWLALLQVQTLPPAVTLDGQAVVPLAPQLAVEGLVGEFRWSPDGSTILATRRRNEIPPGEFVKIMTGEMPPPVPPTEVWTYRTRTGVAKRLFTRPNWRLLEASWFTGSNAFVLSGASTDANGALTVELVTPSGEVKMVGGRDEGYAELFPSPVQAMMMVFVQRYANGKFTESEVILLGPNGPIGRSRLPEEVYAVGWIPDGSGALAYLRQTASARRTKVVRIDLENGTLGAEVAAPSQEAPETPTPIWMEKTSVAPPAGVGRSKIPVLVLTDGKAKAMLASDADLGSVSPNLDGAAYVAQGALFYVPFARMDAELYGRRAAIVRHNEVMSKAKQVGTALAIFAADMDDTYPSNGPGWQEKLSPYVKEAALLDGFVYTFKGGSVSGIKDPANTIIGYVPGPGGRAVVYADTSVRWKPGG